MWRRLVNEAENSYLWAEFSHAPPPACHGGIGTSFNTMCLGPPRVSTSNKTLIRSAAFADHRQVTSVNNLPEITTQPHPVTEPATC